MSIIESLIKEGVLVDYWDFRSRSALSFSKNVNNGVLDSTYWTGNGLGFNEKDLPAVWIVDSATVPTEYQSIGQSGDDYTVFALVDIKNGSGGSSTWWNDATIFEIRQQNADPTLPVSFGISSNKLGFGRRDSSSNNEVELGSSDVNDGLHFVAAVVDDDDIDFYIDNSLDVSRTFTTATGDCSLGSSTSNITIGSRTTNAGAKGNYIKGIVKSVGIVSRALTVTELSQLYDELKEKIWTTNTYVISRANLFGNVNEKGIVGCWDTDIFGTNVVDKKNNNNGTINSGLILGKSRFSKNIIFNGSSGYIDIGNTNQTVRTVSFWIKPNTTTESIIDFDGGTHSISISAGTLTATGFSSPSIYVNGELSTSVVADLPQHIMVTTATGFSASDMDIGRISSSYFDGFIIGNVSIYDDEKSVNFAKYKYEEGCSFVFKTDFGANEFSSNITSCFISNTLFVRNSGTWQFNIDIINGKCVKAIENIGGGIAYVPTSLFRQTNIEASYGRWKFFMCSASSNNTFVIFIHPSIGGATGGTYNLFHRSAGDIDLRRDSVTLIDGGTFSKDVWNEIEIIRKSNGYIEFFVNGVSQGNATDNVYNIANNFILFYNTGDKFAYSDCTGRMCFEKGLIP